MQQQHHLSVYAAEKSPPPPPADHLVNGHAAPALFRRTLCVRRLFALLLMALNCVDVRGSIPMCATLGNALKVEGLFECCQL